MTTFQLSNSPGDRHRTVTRTGGVEVDGIHVPVRSSGSGSFNVAVDGRDQRLHAVAHGDAVYVQLKGRAWRLDRLDATRSTGAAADGAAGSTLAPMPGVVVSVQAVQGQNVKRGDALLVIESMKLQMTIEAAADGRVAEMPFTVGQSFQRGALLVRTAAQEIAA